MTCNTKNCLEERGGTIWYIILFGIFKEACLWNVVYDLMVLAGIIVE